MTCFIRQTPLFELYSLNTYMNMKDINVGEKAPLFALKDQAGHSIKLEDFRDKQPVVLIFYPGDLTPGCTIQLCAIRDDWSKFQSLNIALFGINHGKAESHQRFAEKNTLPMPLLIDPTKKIAAAYGAIRSLFGIRLIRRRVVGIDKQGIVRYIKNGMPKDADILKAMKSYS